MTPNKTLVTEWFKNFKKKKKRKKNVYIQTANIEFFREIIKLAIR